MSYTFKAQIKIMNDCHKAKIERVVNEKGGTVQECRNEKFIFVELPMLYRTSYEVLLAPDETIEQISAMKSGQWFTPTEVTGTPSLNIFHLLHTMATANDDIKTLQECNGRVLISRAGAQVKYQWVSKEYWISVLNG